LAQVWWVYILRCRSGALYTGITTDIDRRFRQHCRGTAAGGAKYFAMDPAESVVYLERMTDRSSASAREFRIKRLKRSAKEQLILTYAASGQDYQIDTSDVVETIKLSQ
jgi:putative endonuclease